MIINETPLLGRVVIETGAWSGSAYVWTDQTTTALQATYEEGGRLGTPGASMVDTGTLAVVYRDMATVPVVGSLIRIRRAGTSEYAFTGYVQDVANKVTYDFSVSSSPITFTTLYCLDWVGLASQFQVLGVGGKNSVGQLSDPYAHYLDYRIFALNYAFDTTGGAQLINYSVGAGTVSPALNDTDKIGTISDHLDLAAISAGANWNATHVLPTNPTTGRDGLIEMYKATSSGSSGETFTDGAGAAGELHYTEIDFESSSANVTNSIVLNNRALYGIPDAEILTAGGVDDRNFVEIDGVQRSGFMLPISWKEQDATSIANYGLRQSEIDTCLAVAKGFIGASTTEQNLIANPSVEYNADGYTTNSTFRIRRAKPSDDANPFSPPSGLGSWCMRNVTRTASANPLTRFSGINSDGITVFAGNDYNFSLYAYRGIPNRADVRVRARITWLDQNEDTISTVDGPQVSVPGSTWVQASTGRLTAPAGTVSCNVSAEFNRSGGGNFSVGDRCWTDGFSLYAYNMLPGASNPLPPYFDGDTPNTSTYLHLWTGSPGASPSYRDNNLIDTRAVDILAQYATTSNRVTRIRWNAQEDLTAVAALRVGRSVVVKNSGTTGTYRIVGISGELTRSRYVIDYYLIKI